MFSVLVAVLEIGPKYSAQMVFAKDNDMVGAFAANTSVKPLDDFEPVPGRNEVVAASNRHLFLLSLDSPDEAWYFPDDGTTKQ